MQQVNISEKANTDYGANPSSLTVTLGTAASTDVDAALLSRDALTELSRTSPPQANKLLATLLARLTARLRAITKKLRQADRVNHTLQTELAQIKAAASASAKPKDPPPADSGMILL